MAFDMNEKELKAGLSEKEKHDAEQIMPRMLDITGLTQSQGQREYTVADMGIMEDESDMDELYIRPIPPAVSMVADKDIGMTPEPPKNLHAGHRNKVRKRFLDEGLSGFQKHQILELLLFYAIPRVDTNEIAHRLLNAYHGNLSEVLGADVKSLTKVEGIGESAAILLSMMPQLFRVYREELLRREGISGRKKVEQYIVNRFTGEQVEKVLVACLDNKWNLIGDEKMSLAGDEFVSTGTVSFSIVDRRAIIEMCLRYNATAVIIAHNHPRGTALPSREDLTTTLEVRDGLRVIGVRLIDHLIVASEDYISLACSKKYCDLF